VRQKSVGGVVLQIPQKCNCSGCGDSRKPQRGCMSRFEAKHVGRSCLFVCMFAVVVVEPDVIVSGSRFIGTRRRAAPGSGSSISGRE
jgi:hypothetical protein